MSGFRMLIAVISLHTRSVWEVICDALASLSGNQMSRSQRIPYSWIKNPPPKWNFLWMDFESELTMNTPHTHIPTQIELLMEDLGTSVLNLPKIPPPRLELVNEDLGTLVLSLPRIPSPIITSHGGIRDLSSELTKNNPLPPAHPKADWNFSWRTWILVLSLPRILPHPDWNSSWKT